MTLTDARKYRFSFGQYAGQLVCQVVDTDPGYIEWLKREAGGMRIADWGDLHTAINLLLAFKENPRRFQERAGDEDDLDTN